MKSVLLTLGLVVLSFSLSAQMTSKGAAAPSPEDLTVVNLNDSDWSFYSDDTNRTYFIDFEKINVNLSDVVVKNKDGEIVMRDDVIDLPVNAIYELDFTEFEKGDYLVELRSFTGIIRKDISIQ